MGNKIVAIVLAVLLITFLFVFDAYLKSTANNMLEACDALSSSLEEKDWDRIDKNFESLKKQWDDNKDILYVLIHNHECREIGEGIELILEQIGNRDKDKTTENLTTLRFRIDYIIKKENADFFNIF